MTAKVKRREFITLLGGAAAAWPLAARAQQPARLPTVGYMASATRATQGQWAAVFAQRLQELGWTEGRNVKIEVRWAEGRSERFAEIAAEFVALPTSDHDQCRQSWQRLGNARGAGGSPHARY